MGVQREAGEIIATAAGLIHVAPHEQSVQGDEGDALLALVGSVRSSRQRRGGLPAGRVGHLFHAARNDDVHQAGSHGHIRRTKGGRA